ncbi:serine hydrolase [Lentzea sp. NPDC059081]|uniref:serine hydrolase n=1 Tax=Lentzea sp. NPDC059081 TaxID=3346719 RepID=UPI00369712EB
MRTAVVGVAVLLAALVAPAAHAAEVPTAGEQLGWVVDATGRVPVAEDEVRQHVAQVLLDAAGGPAGVNAALTGLGRLQVKRVVTETPEHVQAAVSSPVNDYLLDLHVDQAGLVDGLRATPDAPVPTSWAELDSRLAALGSRVSFGASEIQPDGRCRDVHGVDDTVQRPLGSGFKLYVLGALGKAVAEHRASWTDTLAIRDDWKSLPSGELQNQPAGTPLPLTEYADKMISISDNTATDHLIHRLGRGAVERQLVAFGNQRPSANVPFLTTKAMFELKATKDTSRMDAYLALPRWARPAAVAGLERLPLTGLTAWTQPREIDRIEWFGSPDDICRAYSGLRAQNQPEIAHALSLNDGGLRLDRTAFPEVWFKGGSEPGVLTLNYLARTADGRSLVVSVMVSDPAAPLNESRVAATGIALAKGAMALMAAAPRR